MRRRQWPLAVLCFILGAALFGFITWAKEDDKATRARMEEEAELATPAPATPTPTAEPTEAPTPEPTAEPTLEPTATPTPEVVTSGISFRGEGFSYNDEVNPDDSIATLLYRELERMGASDEVYDGTKTNLGSLSMMSFAGVDHSVIDGFIEKHKLEAPEGAELRVTETNYMTFTGSLESRKDKGAIPVVALGINGGWGNDPKELVEQINAILDTYSQKEKYLVIGAVPGDNAKKAEAEAELAAAFEGHYISATEAAKVSMFKTEGHDNIVSAVAAKLDELGYLTKQ